MVSSERRVSTQSAAPGSLHALAVASPRGVCDGCAYRAGVSYVTILRPRCVTYITATCRPLDTTLAFYSQTTWTRFLEQCATLEKHSHKQAEDHGASPVC
jgi:hypothetical protein